MPQSFSERNGYAQERHVQLESVDPALRNRIWNVFYEQISGLLGFESYGKLSIVEKLLDTFGRGYGNIHNLEDHTENLRLLKALFLESEWHFVYDFIESVLALSNPKAQTLSVEFNHILEEEKSGYRIVNGQVTPVTNEQELASVEQATKTEYDSVNTHMEKALTLYSKRKDPDYENSIKESISAVESLCRTITGDDKATLGEALKRLESCGLNLHGAFRSGLEKLYGYASDENGIRHGGIDFKGASPEDAKLMLVICSAFVNFIIEKREKETDKK